MTCILSCFVKTLSKMYRINEISLTPSDPASRKKGLKIPPPTEEPKKNEDIFKIDGPDAAELLYRALTEYSTGIAWEDTGTKEQAGQRTPARREQRMIGERKYSL